ncbi:hypothetical protein F8388_002185 [Cannabis sativa]|uniref:Uncharacterized protein n=1 Tax=Cannabis sativa TaxID=3483 RepID=A0A7J6FUJ9_CANSA|nr:hypothetical protein F8388_002185 [Cannabis sativa]
MTNISKENPHFRGLLGMSRNFAQMVKVDLANLCTPKVSQALLESTTESQYIFAISCNLYGHFSIQRNISLHWTFGETRLDLFATYGTTEKHVFARRLGRMHSFHVLKAHVTFPDAFTSPKLAKKYLVLRSSEDQYLNPRMLQNLFDYLFENYDPWLWN